jgi:hypothetical protein
MVGLVAVDLVEEQAKHKCIEEQNVAVGGLALVAQYQVTQVEEAEHGDQLIDGLADDMKKDSCFLFMKPRIVHSCPTLTLGQTPVPPSLLTMHSLHQPPEWQHSYQLVGFHMPNTCGIQPLPSTEDILDGH